MFAAEKIHFGHRLTELGFIEDVKLMQITIPQGKREKITAWLNKLMTRESCRHDEFKSLAHTLASVSIVAVRGRHYLAQFFRVLSQRWGHAFNRKGKRVMLAQCIKDHLTKWIEIMEQAPSSVMMSRKRRIASGLSWSSDACREVGAPSGVGGFLPLGPGYYWFEQFTQFEIEWLNIAHLEMYGCLQNPAVFGHLVEHKVMYDDCDNEGVYHALREDYAHDPALQMMVLERWKPLAQHDIETIPRHFPGWLNCLADHISRGRIDEFLKEAAARNFSKPVELDPDKDLRAFLHTLACMVRDHKSTTQVDAI